jgi:ketosteroid isomerase-like protein
MKNDNIASAEAQIRQQIDSFVKAFRNKDVDLMMSLFSSQIVSFDIIPPLQYEGSEVYRKVWEETFELFQDPIDIEIRNLSITAGEDVAFSHNFLQLKATMTNEQKINYWERLTCCFQKIDGKWLIVHEHVSLPADLKSGKAVMDLTP